MKSLYVVLVGFLTLFLGAVVAACGYDALGESIGMVGGVIMIPGYLVAAIVELIVRREELEKKRLARLEKVKERKKLAEENRRKYMWKEIERNKKRTIVEAKYLGSGATTQKRGGLGGAVLGGMVAGPLGAVVGAAVPKNSDGLQRFAVKYADGHVAIKEVHPNSWEYKELMKYVKWDEL